MNSIKNLLDKSRKGLSVLIASTVLSVAACNSNDGLRQLGFCEIPENHSLEEICGNLYEEGHCNPEINDGCDDNCDGRLYDGCDADGDGYCGDEREIVYEIGDYPLEACPNTFQHCDEEKCDEILLDCNDNNDKIYHGAIERCNKIDDDCDKIIDDSFPEKGDLCGISPELDGVGTCKAGDIRCFSGQLECRDVVLPEDEVCDGLDNDCNGLIDDYVTPEFCFEEYLPDENGDLVKVEGNPDTQYTGLCRPGVKTCTTSCSPDLLTYEICETGMMGGDKMCWGAHVGREDVCDGLDNNCDGYPDEDYDIDLDGFATCLGDCDDSEPRIHPGAEEIGCNGVDENCDGEDAVGIDEDNDGYSPTGGLCGPIDCDDNDFERSPGLWEWCDCKDNDCNGIVDDDLHTTTPLVFLVGTDCSGSMMNEIGAIEDYNSTAPILDCFSEDYLYVTNVVGDNPPHVSGALMTVAEWQSTYRSDTPNASCSGSEPMLNIVAYGACVKEGMGSHPICQAIDDMIPFSFKDPNNPIWPPGLWSYISYILLFTDENAQWQKISPTDPEYNQEEIAQLAADAGIIVDAYCLSTYHDFETSYAQGYGYFSTLTGGTLYDLTAEVDNGTLGKTVADSFINEYCID